MTPCPSRPMSGVTGRRIDTATPTSSFPGLATAVRCAPRRRSVTRARCDDSAMSGRSATRSTGSGRAGALVSESAFEGSAGFSFR